MALFDRSKKDWDFEVSEEGEDTVLYVSAEGLTVIPSIEDSGICMAHIVEILTQVERVTKIVFMQKRDYEYDFAQTQMLYELATIYKKLVRQKALFSYNSRGLSPLQIRYLTQKYAEIQGIVFKLLKQDPIGAYVELRRVMRREKIEMERMTDQSILTLTKHYLSALTYILNLLEQTKLATLAKPYLPGFKLGDRDIYRNIFAPTIKPDFMFTKLMANYPADGEEVDSYKLGDSGSGLSTDVTVFNFPDSIETLYHIVPPEFKLSEDKYELLDMARRIMAEHKPRAEEFTDPHRMRQVFFNVGRDLMEELSEHKQMKLKQKELDLLTNILVRYTVGFGLIEVLLEDEKVQDISVNSPMGKIPIFIVHGDYFDCKTNIIPTIHEAESWASKLRMISGRPLDEADPILDTELELPCASTRVSTISRPLDPTGLAFSFRRHRDKPWTLPLFMKAGMVNSIGAGVLSFLIDGTRSMLIAGTRSSGKSSFLSGLLVEIMRRYRIITIEDTLELPGKALRDLGYNIQQMKVASALAKESTEMNAADGIRATLRLGDSALIVGEVRSKEAVALYEAMRVGAAANVVAGTIHGDSPYGVYDRVVNDIGIPKTSFKATDLIIVANPVKSADGLHKFRRVIQVTEVRKGWEDDPLAEGGFVDLLKYDVKTDQLQVTDDLINGDSEIMKLVAANVKEFAGNWDALWENIELRARLKQRQVDTAKKLNNFDLLEAPFTITCNDRFHILCDKIKEEVGAIDPKRVEFEWDQWLHRECKKKGIF